MEQHTNRYPKKSSTFFFILTALLLGFLGSLLFILPQRTYSENENRYLTTFQPVSFSGFIDRSLQENLTDSTNDQFLERDFWIKCSTSLQRSVGFHDIGSVYIGNDGYYFERILDSHIPENRYKNNLRCLEQFTKEHAVVSALLPVPSAGTILKKQLPDHAVLYNTDRLYEYAKQSLQQTKLLDIRPALSSSSLSEQIYFKTDHHWTIYGAYQAYSAWCGMHHTTTKPLSDFSLECASPSFFGTLYSKAPAFTAQPDEFWIPKKLVHAEVTIDAEKANGIYDWQKLQTKDKYAVYFGGNYGRIDLKMHEEQDASLTSQNTHVLNKLLIIKDSFANSFVPFLMENCSQIIMLDLRYYNQSVLKLIQNEQPDEVLFIYEMSNFAQDMNFFKILK